MSNVLVNISKLFLILLNKKSKIAKHRCWKRGEHRRKTLQNGRKGDGRIAERGRKRILKKTRRCCRANRRAWRTIYGKSVLWGQQCKEGVEKIVLKIMKKIASNKTFAAAQRATGERHCSRPKWQNYATVWMTQRFRKRRQLRKKQKPPRHGRARASHVATTQPPQQCAQAQKNALRKLARRLTVSLPPPWRKQPLRHTFLRWRGICPPSW